MSPIKRTVAYAAALFVEGREFDYQLGLWGSSLTQSFWPRYDLEVYSVSNTNTRNLLWGVKAAGALSSQPCHVHVPNVFKSWSPQSLPTPAHTLLYCCRPHCPSGIRWGFAADRLLGLRVLIPPRPRISVSCVCQRSPRRADPSSRGVLPTVVCVTGCDYESLNMRKPTPTRAVDQ